MRLLLTVLLLGLPVRAEVIDRIAITINYQVVTESQIDEELRVTAFLNSKPIERSDSSRRAAAERLIEQYLIRREMDLSRYDVLPPAEVRLYIAGVEHEMAGGKDLSALFGRYRLDEPTIEAHLALQLMVLRFVEFRFRPEASVSDADVAAYIRSRNPAHPTAISAAEREAVRKVMVASRTDAALDNWLESARKRFDIFYLDRSLQ